MNKVSNMRLVSEWASMYADWEEGIQVSPSSDDLLRVAERILRLPSGALDHLGDLFFEFVQDTTSLEQQADWLAAHIAPDPKMALSFDQVEAAGLDGTLRNM